jgi:hypothetical protein
MSAGRSASHPSGTWSGEEYDRGRTAGGTGTNSGAAMAVF